MARKSFRMPDYDVLYVTEYPCPDVVDPDFETIIAMLSLPGKALEHKVFKPVAEVTIHDILTLVGCRTQV